MALGEEDFGLYGVVGGLTVFITYLNGLLSGAIGRFFAISVGEQKKDFTAGLESSRKWFTTAVLIQTFMPTGLMLVCYPFGEWAVQNFLTIPQDRIHSCIWVWRFACTSCYLTMVTMPWNSMYVAHQYIAELTIYSFATSTLNVICLYYMVTHPADWLAKYAGWQCALTVLPNLIIAIRAQYLFQECKIIGKYLRCWSNVKEMGAYALWTAWGWLGAVLRGQGSAILINKCFGARANAGVNVGTVLSGHCETLAGSMFGAFSPAIYNAWGAKNYEYARKLSYQVCKIGTLCVLIFAIPLSIEVREVLSLWLISPPEYATGMCLFVLIMGVIDKLATGHMICVNANGRVAEYQAYLGTSLVLTLPLAWVLIKLDMGVYSVGWAMVATMSTCATGRILFARKLVGMSARYWFKRIFFPLLLVMILSLLVGFLPHLFMEPSFARVCVTTIFVELFLIPFAWFLLLESSERDFIISKLKILSDIIRG